MRAPIRPVVWIALTALLCPSLAWSPAPDPSLAQRIVDGIYSRISALPTTLNLSLEVSGGAFPAGSSVGLLSGDSSCLSNWLRSPTDPRFGSYPVAITLAGQAYQVALVAQSARNAFKSLSGKDALEAARQKLPDGHLQVYVRIAGLAQEAQRAAYNLGIKQPASILRPYKTAYLEDWTRGSDGRFGGTMLYYFDLTQATLGNTLSLVVQTEADNRCTYTVGADLSRFY